MSMTTYKSSNNSCYFSELSQKLTKELPKDVKKNNGIYFTPPETVCKTLELIEDYINDGCLILEPSIGSCEFLQEVHKMYPNAQITGIEYNKVIYDAVKSLENDKINIINADFLKFDNRTRYDLIIGNPPYYVVKKEKIDAEYYEYFDGRPNIFVIFIIKCLNMLNEGGILAFILPRNFLNCLYYNKTRKYIDEHFKIISIEDCNDKYLETQQDTVIFIVQKKNGDNNSNGNLNSKYVMRVNDYVIFGGIKNIEILKSLCEGSRSLADMGFKVNVGTVVWNQCKDILTNDSKYTRLVYSGDIKDNQLIMKKYSDDKKKNFIKKKGVCDPVLVINRGYGVGSYNFEYCLIEGGFEYLIENHLICIKYSEHIDNDSIIELYKKIIKSLKDHRTAEFIKIYFGNNAINTTELNYILPIYV